jgi:LysR family transcriptional regulator, regulator for bpeEF and oprC
MLHVGNSTSDLESIRVFVKVVELGSFTRAADLLLLPKSTVSRAVSRLEAQSGTQLMLRTTRSLKLTAAGQALYESGVGPVRALEELRRSLQDQDQVLSGSVKITTTEDLGIFAVSPALGSLARKHPGLSFEFNYTDELVDLVKQGYDLAIRRGRLNPSRFRATRLGETALVLVASPGYLESRPAPKSPKDLAGHDCLAYSPALTGPRWTLVSKKGTATVPIRIRASGNQMGSLAHIASRGGGIAFLPRYVCGEDLDRGRLVRVLPEWSGPRVAVWMVSPRASTTPARMKLVSEALAEGVRKLLER